MGLGGFVPDICGLVRHVIPAADHLTTCPGLREKSSGWSLETLWRY